MVKENSVILNEIDKARLKLSIEHYTKYFIGKRTCEISKEEALKVISLAVREFAMDRMYQTIARYNKVNSKRVYYLSIEYLIGRSLENNLHNLGLFNILKNIKIDGWPWESLEEIFDTEYDPALGNGGLGRLAACYLDSMASLGIPGFGYGINYEYGLFKQKFENGYQVEMADSWEGEDSPWQFARPDRRISIPMYGEVETQYAANGEPMFIWKNSAHIYGIPFDFPVVGYNGKSVNYLRLFSAEGDEQLDINVFNKGGYIDALKDKIENETISKVLYPSDSIESGKELRLKQQYFFVSCAIQDIIRRFMEKSNDFHRMPEYICIQLNDTQDSGQAGIFEAFLVCPLPAVLVFSFVQRFVIGRVEIADTVCQTGIHDVEVLIGQSQIYYQVRFEGVEQADEFFHVVCIDLCCLYLYILNIGGDLVALAFRAAGNHDIGKDIRVHRDLLNSNGTNAPCTNN